ncbi:hypothetical protein AVEN_202754-1 [Araneus ventricosus]|uniref:Uncharacterized protein n=1 Tax=Araneus ventricosus TaxID=182803 RepID=A0A4Y2L007_ARAVE|nr:hypothetical protein AVEN_202754-1 [Araneus ventricosus]
MQEWAVQGSVGAGPSILTSSGHWWVAQLIDENPAVESLQWLVDCDVCMGCLLRLSTERESEGKMRSILEVDQQSVQLARYNFTFSMHKF